MAWLWLLSPFEQTVEVLRLREGAWTIAAVHSDRTVVRAQPFDAVGIALGALWPDAGLAR